MTKSLPLVAAFLLLSGSAIALEMPLEPRQALAHEGECISVEGRAHISVDQQRPGMDIQLGDGTQFEGYVPLEDEQVYPDLPAMEGRLVDVTGVMQFHLGEPEVKMTQHHQLIAAPPRDRPRPQILC